MGGAPQLVAVSSNDSDVPLYPQSSSENSHSDRPAPSLPSNASPSRSLASRELSGDLPTASTTRRHLQYRHPGTASTTTSFTSASADTPARPSSASAYSSRHTSPRKPATPSRIGRDFEALLASDETYVLRESSSAALDTEGGLLARPQSIWSGPSTSAKRVIVERRRQPSTSSLTSSANLDEVDEDEELLSATPRPSHMDAFQSPARKPQSTAVPGMSAQSMTGTVRANGAQVPASPDRTTSLQRHTTGSSAGSSPSSKRLAAPISTIPGSSLSPQASPANGAPRSRPRLNSSVGLEQEIQSVASRQGSSDPAASMGSFRQRMKKTSGFLRRLRKDTTPIRREKDAAKPGQPGSAGYTFSAGSNPSTTSLGRSGNSDHGVGAASLGRMESEASVGSVGASSATGSAPQNALFASADVVAVPSIPERFLQPSNSSDSQTATGTCSVEASMPDRNVAKASAAQTLAPMNKAAFRIPSAPASVTEWSTADKFALPQRSSSQGHEHQRNKSLASSDSTGAIRLAVEQLSSHMDDAWKEEPAREVQVAEQPAAPALKQAWGPSPQLPELGIDHYKERSGSFLEEPELVTSDALDGVQTATPQTARSFSASSHSNTPASRVASQALDSNKAAGLGILPREPSESGPQMRQTPSSDPQDTASARSKRTDSRNDSTRQVSKDLVPHQPTKSLQRTALPGTPPAADLPRDADSARNSPRDSMDPVTDNRRRRMTDSGASMVSMRSFETAAESAGIGSADPKVASFNSSLKEEQKLAVTATTISPSAEVSVHSMPRTQSPAANDDNHVDQDDSDNTKNQEQSVRLVTKRSKTEDINLSSEPNAGLTKTIITAPASPGVNSSTGPKAMEQPEQSLLRPGHNGSLNCPASAPLASGRAGGTGMLLSTPSALRSPSPVSSPASARTSFDASVMRPINEPATASPALAASAQELATKCWEEDPAFLKREKVAEWLGGLGLVNRAARSHYFANFDFSGLRLDVAFRRLCDKLFLRAETQQIDRILAAFSQRYYECNPDSIFGSADVIHSVVFSILLLNTDLHIAELQERMTLKQFVRNTLGAIAESGGDDQSLSTRNDSRSSFSVAPSDLARSMDAGPQKVDPAQRRNSISSYLGNRSKQASSTTNLEASTDAAPAHDTSRPGTATSGAKGKEAEIETLLRDIYAAVKAERILLPSPETSAGNVAAGRPSGTFSPMGGGRRKMGMGSDRMTALKRGSIRGIQGLLGGLGPNAALLDPALSPNPSRSSVDSWGRTSQSLAASGDRDRMLSPLPTITPGFASTLSHTIIKESMEEDAGSGLAKSSTANESTLDDEDDDDALALAGPPWAKEGSLTRKHLWESTGKRAKDKTWTEVFVVVSKGTLSMFRFDLGGSSSTTAVASKSKSRPSMAAPVGGGSGAALGGGNWLSNATCLGEISLAHSLANALPRPGYNKARPHVFALTLPGGKVYLFQTGHEELIHEWVSTCNYWAARQSKEPLPGGVSNMEYGWNKVLPQLDEDDYEELDSFSSNAHMSPSSSLQPQQPTSSADSRSVRSGKSSKNRTFASPATSAAASINTSSNVGYLTNERTFINEWRTPQLPTLPSALSEERQLSRLEKQVSAIEQELTLHNELRQPMLQLYSPKGGNYAKALGNWERKSNWLLQELVKYQSYVESLRKSSDVKAERKAKREVEEMVREGDEMLARLEV